MTYRVELKTVASRALAATRARLPLNQVSHRFAEFLTPVYDTARAAGIALDGQNVFVYENCAAGAGDVTFGVGVKGAFTGHPPLVAAQTPSGVAAHVTHWGDYSGLGAAHAAVTSWCRETGKTLAGPSWEVYGHWSDDPSKLRTDIFYLLGE